MKVREIMERSGVENTGFAIAFIKDAMKEVNMLIEDNVIMGKTDIEEDQRYYSIPTDLIELRSVMVFDDDNDKYVRIPRVIGVSTIDEDGV